MEYGVSPQASKEEAEKYHEDCTENTSDQRSPRSASLSSLRWLLLCSSMFLVEMQAALDSTITANLQPAIINTLGEISKFSWINITYNLGMGGSCLLWGKLLACYDSKKILLVARLLFAIGSTLTAAAPSMNVFIVGKTITGIGSSGSYISIINIITAFTSAPEQARYFGCIGFMWGLGTILGPSIGGAFAATAAGSSLALIMSVCLYTTEINTSHGTIYGYLILGGVGTGLYAMNAGPVMSAIVAKEHIADASTVFGCVDTLCGAFSVGVANSIFVNRASDSIQKLLPSTSRATVQELIAGVGASLTNELSPPLRIAVLQAVLAAIKDVWVQMIGTAALSFVLSLFLRNERLSRLSKG
ncbi:hypothetical protein MMC20_003173 [Loxospora ochrophaea]|nr:hypothetical protein [Loxospora ochrophaea]